METLGIVVSIGIAALIIAAPIYAVLKGSGFFRTNLISIPVIFALVTAGAFWPHFHKDVRLKLMGVNSEGMSYEERTRNVPPEKKGEAEDLYWSLMGIGWPLQAIIGMVIVSPYPSVVWLVGWLARRIGNGRNSEKSPNK